MAEIKKTFFGITKKGETVDLYTFLNKNNVTMEIITYGGAIKSLVVPAKNGKLDIILGHDSVGDYEKQDKYLGAILGRFANRIGGGKFNINGKEYGLCCNNGKNHLHGGREGFDKKVWAANVVDGALYLNYFSPDKEEGYPGNLAVQVKYSLSDQNEFVIETTAKSDSDTVVNISNHPYFNLEGHQSGNIGDHMVTIFANSFTPIDKNTLPTGDIVPVDGGVMDFLAPKQISKFINADDIQIKNGAGYDHNWVIERKNDDGLKKALEVYAPKTNVKMEMYTTQKGVQFYSGNFLDGEVKGKDGVTYPRRSGFSMEAQGFPDATSHPNFPTPFLKAGRLYKQCTVYKVIF